MTTTPKPRRRNRAMEAALVELRHSMREEFLDRLFLLGNFIGDTDTYKRTMGAAWPRFALDPAAYHLTFRKGLTEPGAGDKLVMAGHELLNQWFRKPLSRTNIRLAQYWFDARTNDPDAEGSYTGAFPTEMWNSILRSQRGEDIYMPVDIWGFPGGQTFIKGVPVMSYEGMGGAVSYVEPAMCRYFAPVIQATKARLMKLACKGDAEFGLRSAPLAMNNLILLLARYIGGRGSLTSNDTAEFMYPELFRSVGSTGHEGMSHTQRLDRSLTACEFETMDTFAEAMKCGFLLGDLVDAETVGVDNVMRCILKHQKKGAKLGARLDSGDIAAQCVQFYFEMKKRGIEFRKIVFEDEVTPETVMKVFGYFCDKTGLKPEEVEEILIPGAGGYWWRAVHRDTVSAKFARSSTNGNPNMKFSNSPGKESVCGTVRVYGRGRKMVVADVSEVIDGIPLYVPLVQKGRIVYSEAARYEAQATRADQTWNQYDGYELSPLIQDWMKCFRDKRDREVKAARTRLAHGTGSKS